MTTTVSWAPTGLPARRSNDAVDSDLLSAREFRELVEVLRRRDEFFFVIELQLPWLEDAKRLLVELQESDGKDWFVGWVGQNRIGMLGQDALSAASVRRWSAKQNAESPILRVFIQDRGRLRRQTKKRCPGVFGNRRPDQHETLSFGKQIQPICELYKIQMPIGKRCFDITFALFALVLATPLLCLAAALIKITSCGPLFFVQDRVGHGGQPFRMYKFRTMRVDADRDKRQLVKQNEMTGPAFKMRHDPRVTRVGIWLRRFSIDEIPQLWNVIRGDMSLVGPRPLPSVDWNPTSVRELYRHDVVPGLTCIWQIMGRNEIAWEDWVRLDLFYVRKRCWALDAKILFATVPAVLSQRGAY